MIRSRLHTITRGGLSVAAALALFAAPAQASSAAADTARADSSTRVTVRRGEERLTDTVRAQVEAHRAQARIHLDAGHHGRARRELVAAARLMAGGGVLPSHELYHAATIALVEGRPLVAAELMDMLAADAMALGEPLEQARALLEAAMEYDHAGRKDLARERVKALRTLLASSHIPDDFRAEVDRRVHVAAR